MLEFDIQGMTMAVLAITGGLVLLIGAGELLVRGSVSVAKMFGIPRIIIGMTIVAFGTSVPELFIGIQSVRSGSPGLAMGNVVGSNIANVLLVLGLPSIIFPTVVKEHGVRRNTVMMILFSVIFMWMSFDGGLTFSDGVTLVFLLSAFLAYQAHHAVNSPGDIEVVDELGELEGVRGDSHSGFRIFVFIMLGLIGLPLGANSLVTGSVFVAQSIGVDEALIGLSLVAIGTSLPELAITAIAAFRRHAGVALGNVIGSNIMNLLAVMGISILFAGDAGIPVDRSFTSFHLWAMLLSSAVLIPFAFAHHTISRVMGVVFLVFYFSYIIYIFKNGLMG
jgi:cation:H+ antiporter